MMRYNDDDERTGQRCPRCHCTFTVLPDELGLHDCPRCGGRERDEDDDPEDEAEPDDEPEDEPGPEDDQPPPRPRMRAYVEERSQHAADYDHDHEEPAGQYDDEPGRPLRGFPPLEDH